MNLRRIAPALLLTTALTLSACGGNGNSSSSSSDHSSMSGMGSSSSPSPSSAATGQFNDADVMFAQSMIVHHRQAIEMAKLASSRAGSAQVRQLAAKIEAAQAPEIQKMTKWLTSWGADVPSDDMSGMSGMSGMKGMNPSDMPGMMTAADMRSLRTASGAQFDQQFLDMMIGHHQGAIEMAKTEQKQGKHDEAVALAADIATAQTSEIKTMRNLLGD